MLIKIRQIISLTFILIGYYLIFPYINAIWPQQIFKLISNWLASSFLMFIAMIGVLVIKNEILFLIRNKKIPDKFISLPNKKILVFLALGSILVLPSILGWIAFFNKK